MNSDAFKNTQKIFHKRLSELVTKKIETSQGRLTRKMIAEELDISVHTLDCYCREDDASNPCLKNILSIMDYFNVSIEWLTGRSDAKAPSIIAASNDMGLTSHSICNLVRVNSYQMNIGNLEGFDPPIIKKEDDNTLRGPFIFEEDGTTKNSLTYYMFNEDEKKILDQKRQLNTLNHMIEDWKIIELLNAYLYSVPAYPCEKMDLAPINYDVVLLDKIRKRLNMISRNVYDAEFSDFPEQGHYFL